MATINSGEPLEHRVPPPSVKGRTLDILQSRPSSIVLIGAGLVLALAFVVWDEGTPSAYAHFAYAPIILAAYRFGAAGGALCGILGGFVVAPGAAWVLTGDPASEPSWLVRAAWMSVVGTTLGVLFSYIRAQAGLLDRYLYIDQSTGIPNRVGLLREARLLTREERGGDRMLAVTAIRVANHEALLGSFGYQVADAVMHALASRIRDGLPRSTLLGRTGADELMAVEVVAPVQDTQKGIERVRGLMCSTLQIERMPVYVDTALGHARAPVGTVATEELLVRASAAAGRVRERRGEIGHHDSEAEARRRAALELLADVPAALDRGEMRLVYQPKVALATGTIVGLEALIRWQHPRHGAVSPGHFIPLVEDTALIDDLTRWVLRTAIEQARIWESLGSPRLAVNVSSRNLVSEALLEYIPKLLHTSGLSPSCLELEITETALTELEDAHLEFLAWLREQGVRIAIDDFGTGYASLASIRRLPVDTLKLDRSFICGASTKARDRQMVRRIVQIARDLELEVVGEGVEDLETLQLLTRLRCDQAQGYYICMPLEASEVGPVLEGRVGAVGGSA